MEAEHVDASHEPPQRGHHRDGRDGGQHAPVDEPATTFVEAPRPERLGDEGVESEQQAHPEDGQGHEQAGSETDGADRGRAKGSDHEGVDHAHGHPAELRKDDRAGQAEHPPSVIPARRHKGHPIILPSRRAGEHEVTRDLRVVPGAHECRAVREFAGRDAGEPGSADSTKQVARHPVTRVTGGR